MVTNHLGHQTIMTYDIMGRKRTMQDPNMGTWSYDYFLAGDLKTQTDAKGQTLSFTYDAMGRITTKTQGATTLATWSYDSGSIANSKGRLTRVVDNGADTQLMSYDAMGRVLQTQRTIDGTPYIMAQTYDALSRITGETFPDNDAISYTYNAAGWLDSVSDSGTGYVNGISYNARGQRTGIQYASGISTTFTYDPLSFRLYNRATAAGVVYQNLTYGFDNAGNVTGITDAVGFGTRTFVYDDLNRLTQAIGTFGPNQSLVTQDYSYDAVGNILTKAGVSYCYGYMTSCSDPAHPLALKSTSDGSTFTYDNNGNTQSGGGRSYTWNVENRVDSITGPGGNESMVYDYTGIRVRKIGNAGITYFPFTGYEVNAGVVTKYIRIGIEIIASKQGATDKRFYHNDHLGSVNVITDANGVQVQVNEYDPWGKVSRSVGNVDPNHRFTGQELDSEGNVHYYGGRYYNQDLGRFISPDPFVQEPDDPQNLNRYSYVLNNPQNYIDPSGYFWDELFGFVGEIFSSIFGGSSGGWSGDFGGSSGSSSSAAQENVAFMQSLGFSSTGDWQAPQLYLYRDAAEACQIVACNDLGRSIMLEWNGNYRTPNGLRNVYDGTPSEPGLTTPSFNEYDAALLLATGPLGATKEAPQLLLPRFAKSQIDELITQGASKGLKLSEHAAEQLLSREQGVTMKMLEKSLQQGQQFFDPKNMSNIHVIQKGMASGVDIGVAVDPASGIIKTIMTNKGIVRPRFIPVGD
jgi:RHS repeat-associated protein